MRNVEEAYRLIDTEMKTMEELARSALSSVDSFVEEVVRYSFRFGGKRLRPAILFLSAKVLGKVTEKHVRAAAAIEFVHTASLIHDDILDGASVRRHLATINVQWNAQVGVLAGDLLLTKAMELMTQDDDKHGFCRLTDACRQTCEGELRQIGTIGRFDMTPEEYFAMIAGKTAPLISCSAELGAYHADAEPATVEKFRQFGRRLGMAFQMFDDILDLVGENDTAGKTLRTDLANQKPTLPLLFYLRDATALDRAETLSAIQDSATCADRAALVVQKLCNSAAIDLARREAQKQIDEAVELISGIVGDANAIAGLMAIARYVVNRRN